MPSDVPATPAGIHHCIVAGLCESCHTLPAPCLQCHTRWCLFDWTSRPSVGVWTSHGHVAALLPR